MPDQAPSPTDTSSPLSELRKALGRLETALAVISDGLVISDAAGQVVWSNRAFQRLLGRSGLSLLDQPLELALGCLLQPQQLTLLALDDVSAVCNERVLLSQEPLKALEVERRPLEDLAGKGSILMLRDISSEVSSHQWQGLVQAITSGSDRALSAREQQHLDALQEHSKTERACPITALPNRRGLLEALSLQSWRLQGDARVLYVLDLHLSDLSEITDLHGLEAGNLVLLRTAERLAELLEPEDLLGRTRHDNFVLASWSMASLREASQRAEQLVEAIQQAIDWEGRHLSSQARVGITRSTPQTRSMAELLRQAQAARQQTSSISAISLYQPELQRKPREQPAAGPGGTRLESGLFLALLPIVTLRDGQPQGLEIELRQGQAEGEPINPGVCRSAGRSHRSVPSLGPWIASQVLLQPPCEGIQQITLNVSTAMLRNARFADNTLAELRQHQLDPHRLVLDLPEPALIDASAPLLQQLQTLRSAGVRIHIDDFGTSLAGIGLLSGLPVDGVKVAASLVEALERQNTAAAAISQMLDLSSSLALELIAQGVSSEAQRELLLEMGVRLAQGPLFEPLQPA